MTVQQLGELLMTLNPDYPVILQKDSYGNGYSPLERVREGMYAAGSPWSGEVYDPTDPDKDPNATPCVVLWPIN